MSGQPLIPADEGLQTRTGSFSGNTHMVGFFDLTFDFENENLTIVPNRTVMFTLNLDFVYNNNQSLLSWSNFNVFNYGTYTDVEIDLTIAHPLNDDGYKGYDFRGLFMGRGSGITGWDQVRYPVNGVDQSLINSDGLTRWFNPTEFPIPGIFGFDPLFISSENYKGSATINPFKYFGHGLGVSDDLWTYLIAAGDDIGAFLPNTSNTRHHLIRFPLPDPGIKYNYIIIADWSGLDPQFHPSHARESTGCDLTITPDIYYVDENDLGGDLIIDVSVFNWADILTDVVDQIIIESTVLSGPYVLTLSEATPTGSGDHYLTYHIEILADNIQSNEGNTVTVIAPQASDTYANDFGIPNAADGPLTAYFMYDLFVADEPYEPNLPGDVPIQVEFVTGGLTRPVNLDSPDDGTGRLFIVEQAGVIRIFENGSLLVDPFLDITSKVLDSANEQGLLDVAFHPDYSQNGYFFVNYTRGSGSGETVIERYQVSGDPNIADPASAKEIISFNQPAGNHNGGKLAFGPDGYLYIATGDGGGGGDTFGNGQNLQTLLACLLRLDVDTDPEPYSIPPDNPFVGDPNALDEIWAYGLRNPWQFSFDMANGDIYIADVGQNKWEEIDFQPSDSTGGENYGWNIMEGAHCYPSDPCIPVGILPVAEYDHPTGCSITGFGVYRGTEFPELNGIYFAGDYCTGRLWGLARNKLGEWIFVELLDTSLTMAGAGQDVDGNVYITTFQGAVYRIVAQ